MHKLVTKKQQKNEIAIKDYQYKLNNKTLVTNSFFT